MYCKCNGILLMKKCSAYAVKEIRIPTLWGHISGKLWGSGDQRPILALHGWQDNADTWDTLAPMLAHKRPILSVDWPGHGLSSWYPKGSTYNMWDYPFVIQLIKEHYKWDQITFLTHSLGGISATKYAALFQDQVDGLIAFDNIVISEDDNNQKLKETKHRIIKLTAHERDSNTPLYTYEKMRQLYEPFDNNAVLMKRDTQVNDEGKYYFTRDPRVKWMLYIRDDVNFTKDLVKRIQCPFLYIRANNSIFFKDQLMTELGNVLSETKNNFKLVHVDGNHHVHLNEPEKVAPYVIEFLKKYKLVNNDNVSSKI